jgi:hypothetical protein
MPTNSFKLIQPQNQHKNKANCVSLKCDNAALQLMKNTCRQMLLNEKKKMMLLVTSLCQGALFEVSEDQ